MMVRTQIQLKEEQARILKKLARARGVSMAQLIRHSIDCYIQSAVSPSEEIAGERALLAAGKFRSGRRNVSRTHDSHLADLYGQ